MKKLTTIMILATLLLTMQIIAGDDVTFKNEYETVQKDFDLALKNVKSRAEYEALKKTRTKNYEALLKKYEKLTASDPVEIIRAKVLIKLGKFDDAIKKTDSIIKKNSKWFNDAMLTKVHVYFTQMKIDKALVLFRKIEKNLKPGYDLYQAYQYFAMVAKSDKVKIEYIDKFIAIKDLPEKMKMNKPLIISSKAKLFLDKDKKKAMELYKKALEAAKAFPRVKGMIESEVSQAKFIGSTAPAISAEKWINSNPLALEKLKGKVVIIDFWATWCAPCRVVIPVLVEEYNKYKDKGLVVIGFTKLYGMYKDDKQNKGKVTADVEKTLIEAYVKTNKIPYPIAIANQGTAFQTYKVKGIPTMVFIDKKGKISYIKVGSGSPDQIRKKIKTLLDAK